MTRVNFSKIIINIMMAAVLFVFVFSPLLSFADFRIVTSIVPCGTSANTTPCQTCHLFELGHNIIDFLMWNIAGPLAGLMFIIGGFFIATAGDSPTRRQQGLKIFSSTMWGLAIVFFSYILINTIITVMGPGATPQGNIIAKWFNPPGTFCK